MQEKKVKVEIILERRNEHRCRRGVKREPYERQKKMLKSMRKENLPIQIQPHLISKSENIEE